MRVDTKTIEKITHLEFSKEESKFLESLCDKLDEISEYSNFSSDEMLVEIVNAVVLTVKDRKRHSIDLEKPITIGTEVYYASIF